MAGLEKYEMLTVKRSEIKTAEYNPRYIDEAAKKRLKKGIKKFGLVQPLVWNKKTGVLVSGHQRLAIMDEMEHYPKNDYSLNVCAVDLTEAQERELNVQLNNQAMMGEFDFDILRDVASFDGVDIKSLGFSDSDLSFIFGADEAAMGNIIGDTPEAQNAKGKLKGIKEEREGMKKRKAAENSAAFYCVLIFDDEEQRGEVFKKMGIPFAEEFVPYSRLVRAICNT